MISIDRELPVFRLFLLYIFILYIYVRPTAHAHTHTHTHTYLKLVQAQQVKEIVCRQFCSFSIYLHSRSRR